MLSAKKLQNQYIKLYEQIRKYLWPFETVRYIAELEESVYKRFPDINYIRNVLRFLESEMMHELRDDEELREEFDKITEIANSSSEVFAKLDKYSEVISK